MLQLSRDVTRIESSDLCRNLLENIRLEDKEGCRRLTHTGSWEDSLAESEMIGTGSVCVDVNLRVCFIKILFFTRGLMQTPKQLKCREFLVTWQII
jgi:hypothetical protein